MAKHERPAKERGLKKNFLDTTELIRSIQRAEGHFDCFRRAEGCCDQLDCAWRSYCIEEPQRLTYDGSKIHENK